LCAILGLEATRGDCFVLDATWLAEPPGVMTIRFGAAWLQKAQAPLIMVPSVMVPEEYNVLLNPAHPTAQHISASVLRQYVYDPRF
jgi:RES domain-containing protein